MKDRQYYCIRNHTTMGFITNNPLHAPYRETDSPNEFISVAPYGEIGRARDYLKRYEGGIANMIMYLEEDGSDIDGYEESMLHALREVKLELVHVREITEHVTQVVK